MNTQPEKDMIIEFSELVGADIKPSNGTCHEIGAEISAVTADKPVTKAPIHKQIETRTADGKRRITPMFIPLNQEMS